MSSYHPYPNNVVLRSGITIYPSQAKAMDEVLSQLAERCPTSFILVSDVSGQFVKSKGDSDKRHLFALAALVAGDLGASQEIARMTGEYKSCQLVMREGEKYNTYIAEAGLFLVMFVLVDREIPMGWARLLIRKASQQLAEIIATSADEVVNLRLGLSDENLQDAIGDAFDTLLKE